uniref:NADH dehydrogenase subunit 6 n=1 Tax=Gasteruption tournieri TaxID=1115612 RepID=A0A3S8V0S2_9HYME|nr:NADH dehydrogenase subunit 6 [Gasteruption tournieri]
MIMNKMNTILEEMMLMILLMNLIPTMIMLNLISTPKKMFSNNPLMMNMILCMLTLMYSLHMSMLNSSFWFSMITFLMMIGGLLILFLYFTSIAPNEFNNMSMNTLMSMFMKLIMILLILFMIIKIYMINDYMIINPWKNSNNIMYNMMNKMNYIFSSNFIYNYPIYKITLMVIIYLFYTLFIINKLCLNSKKPMRKYTK